MTPVHRIKDHWPNVDNPNVAGRLGEEKVSQAQGKPIPGSARLFVCFVSAVAFVAFCQNLRFWHPHLSITFLLYLTVAFLCSGMKVLPPGVNGNISVNYIFTLLALLEFPIAEATILAVVAAVAQSFWNFKKYRPRAIQVIFNIACVILTMTVTWQVYSGIYLFGTSNQAQFIRLMLAGAVYFVCNTLCLSIVIALSEQKNLRTVWRGFYNWLFVYYLVGASLAEMVHFTILQLGWTFIFALVPLIYIIYRCYRLQFAKLEQEKVHAESMAAMHLRTIETLATAVEAKDECTAEHLRRVQVYSLQIAEGLGLPDGEIEALRAASLLHDIGKLAVPDYIISKPGKLTPEEFDKMKIHTVAGGAILEQVGFGYCVAPIVRSHHERWDGSGYPDGLKGEEIPIGARILAAVDCLDALASHRPYRPALPLSEALQYVISRSGKDFDPRVVQLLQERFIDFEQATQNAPLRRVGLDTRVAVVRGESPAAGFENSQTKVAGRDRQPDFISLIAALQFEVQNIFELRHQLSGPFRLQDMLSMFASRLKEVVPFDSIALFIQEETVLKPKYVSGENSRVFAALEIPIGEGLSGWVAQNHKAIVNGNPSVEPGYLQAATKSVELRSALSVPLGETACHLNGALTLYRSENDAFDKSELRILLAVIGKLSRAVAVALNPQEANQSGDVDALTGLPNAQALFLHLQDEITRCRPRRETFAVLICDIEGFRHFNKRFGHIAGDNVLRRCAEILKENCRSSDYVARIAGDEFAIVLLDASLDQVEAWTHRIATLIRTATNSIGGREPELGVSVGFACFPDHGETAEEIINRADNEMYRRGRSTDTRFDAVETRQTLQLTL